jgi:hypothetical protein
VVRAECHSDDYAWQVPFDAAPWFAQATDGEILDLAACGWGGDYPADAVARFFEPLNAEIAGLFEYLWRQGGRQVGPGFECRVEAAYAVRWVRRHRPHLFRYPALAPWR